MSTCDPYVYRSLLRHLPQLSCLLGCIGGPSEVLPRPHLLNQLVMSGASPGDRAP